MLRLYKYLCRRFINRRKRGRRTPRHLRGVPKRLFIPNRPDQVGDRRNFGHWEGDLVIFRREHGNVTSLVERKSRFTVLIKNQNRKSAVVVGQIKDHLTSLPQLSRRSVTFDRGSGFMGWRALNPHLGLDSYYCDARSPWQKGTNENTNGRIRRFLPNETNWHAFKNLNQL
ncbi:Integrase core domain protein [Polystyrenella longa]|uniref:Integrase core domain protein n=1 Tax=Polystyrenella longa TaxID=2528007 RepID=A0A518CNB2_9PLAN|nr:Integrase core domain protein [Polystyrenella longa]